METCKFLIACVESIQKAFTSTFPRDVTYLSLVFLLLRPLIGHNTSTEVMFGNEKVQPFIGIYNMPCHSFDL